MEEVKNTKLIGIGNEGIKKLEEVESKIVEKIDTEKININKDVDKDYVRALLDGVDILLLTYNSEDKQALQIVNAIGYMADERRVLSVGLDLSEKESKMKYLILFFVISLLLNCLCFQLLNLCFSVQKCTHTLICKTDIFFPVLFSYVP